MSAPSPVSLVSETREEQYHLLVLDRTHTRVLAARPARSWLLPYLRFRTQTPETIVFKPVLSQLGVDATPIHEALLRDGSGGDDDRASHGVAHRYVVLEAQDTHARADRLTWEPLDELLDGRGSPVLPIQETALRTCLDRFQHAVAPFDSPAQLRAVRDWVAGHLRTIGASIAGDFTYYRIRRFDMVIAFPTTKGTIYFKGGPRRMVHEAELTQALHTLMPRHFPGTLAYDAARHWWLTPGVAGVDLTTAPASEDVWLAAVKLLATTQRKTMDARAVNAALAHRRFGARQFAAVAARVQRLLAHGPFRDRWTASRLDVLDRRLREVIERLLAYELPWTWTPAEFVGLHLFNDRGRVSFIGVEDSFLAPPTLAVSRFFHDLTFRVPTAQRTIARLTDTYVDAWRGRIAEAALRGAIADARLCGLLLTFRAHLDRHARHHGLWTSEGDSLPVTADLHEEAHRIGMALVPNTAAAGSARR